MKLMKTAEINRTRHYSSECGRYHVRITSKTRSRTERDGRFAVGRSHRTVTFGSISIRRDELARLVPGVELPRDVEFFDVFLFTASGLSDARAKCEAIANGSIKLAPRHVEGAGFTVYVD